MAKTITGKVTDADTGAALCPVTVTESGNPDNFTQTGADGSYELVIASDSGAVIFQMDGYLSGGWIGDAGATNGSGTLYKAGLLNAAKAKGPAILVTSGIIVLILLLAKKFIK